MNDNLYLSMGAFGSLGGSGAFTVAPPGDPMAHAWMHEAAAVVSPVDERATNVVALVAPPTAGLQAKVEAVQLLEALLAEARAGRIDEVFVVYGMPNRTWSHVLTTTTDAPGLVGRIEIAQQALMAQYVAQQRPKPPGW